MEKPLLPAGLLWVSEMLPLATATLAEHRTGRGAALWSRSQEVDLLGFEVMPVLADNPATDAIPGCRARNKHGLTHVTAEPAPTESQGVDLQLKSHGHRQGIVCGGQR